MSSSENNLSAPRNALQTLTVSAPARVNLIGEHTDYTGGYVLPMAISFTTTAHIKPATDGMYHFRSAIFDTTRAITPADRGERTDDWSDYPVGVLRELQTLGLEPPAFDLLLEGNIPLGSGLSSSASVEVATAVALLAFAGTSLPPAEIATLCRRAENEYVGSPCGIMDQFIITMAQEERALLLNTRELTFEQLPLNLGGLADCCIVIVNSMVKHSIAGGDYGLRRREVEAGQAAICERFPAVRDLGDATLEQLEACSQDIADESYRRCRHIISENARVLQARAALLAGDAELLGDMMTKSHASQRDDFECSVEEIDFLVDTALKQAGCYGARLTGGGFGGCTVNLVKATDADAFSMKLKAAYQERFGVGAEIYVCTAVDGAIARLNGVAA